MCARVFCATSETRRYHLVARRARPPLRTHEHTRLRPTWMSITTSSCVVASSLDPRTALLHEVGLAVSGCGSHGSSGHDFDWEFCESCGLPVSLPIGGMYLRMPRTLGAIPQHVADRSLADVL